ncbi:MAG: TonB family protein [Verrucomicrobia bacterium]|nr:TonB family protein [Cytophagales bacterium]
MTYLLQVNLYLTVLYGFYRLLLRNETFHQSNRIFLLSAVVLSLLLPVFQMDFVQSWFLTQKVQTIVQTADIQGFLLEDVAVKPVESPFFVEKVALSAVYFSGILVFFIGFLIKIFHLQKQMRNPEGKSAFSFLGFRFVPENSIGRAIISIHEHTHAKQFHSADMILLELVCIANWFNPVMYSYKQSLKNIHEFIADREAIKHSDSASYAMLLFSQSFGVSTELAHHFFDTSTLKRRIVMIAKTKSPKKALLKYGLALPLFVLMLVFSSAFVSEKADFQGLTQSISNFSTTHIDSVQVSGKIFSATDGKALPGAVVVISNTNKGTTCNDEGYFSIKAPANATIAISFVGLETGIFRLNASPEQVVYMQLTDKATVLNELEVMRKQAEKSKQDAETAKALAEKQKKEAEDAREVAEKSRDMAKTQAERANGEREQANEVFTQVEVMPEFPGGMSELSKYLTKNIEYPFMANKVNISGKVYVSFIVNETGNIENAEIVKGIGYGWAEEALRLVKNMPQWFPGKQSGKAVKVKYVLPINFSITPEGLEDALFILNGKEMSKYDVEKLQKKMKFSGTRKVEVIKGEEAIKRYGEKGKNGVVVITSKKK